MVINVSELARYGFVFPQAKALIKGDLRRLAMDAALTTAPNATIPVEFTAFIDPQTIDILTAPTMARALFSEVKKGDWTTSYAKFRVNELTGRTDPYTDYGQSGTSGVNYNWLNREQYLFQTIIHYGDLEEATHSVARINLASEKQRSAANTIDIDSNKFYLQGVANREIYGFLNEPNMPAAITATPGAAGTTFWADKTTAEIYNDVRDLFKQLVSQSAGWITNSSSLVLVMSPELAVNLGAATDYNVSVTDMLNKYFTSLTIVTLPELSSEAAGETMIMYVKDVKGMPTGELAFGEKIRAGRIVPELSSFAQKYTSTTYGFIMYVPFAFAQMIGM